MKETDKASLERISAKQRRTRFVKEFLKDRNATRAAKAAGYSEKTAGAAGSRLLSDVKIRQRIEAENDKHNANLDVSVARIKKELARLAFFDPRAFFRPDGSLKPLDELTDDQAAVIAGIDCTELFAGNGDDRNNIGLLKKIKLVDKLEALEKLGRHLKMFTDRVEFTGDNEMLTALAQGRKRAAEKNANRTS